MAKTTGRYEEGLSITAEDLLLHAHDAYAQQFAADNVFVVEAWSGLVELYEAIGRPADAETYR